MSSALCPLAPAPQHSTDQPWPSQEKWGEQMGNGTQGGFTSWHGWTIQKEALPQPGCPLMNASSVPEQMVGWGPTLSPHHHLPQP